MFSRVLFRACLGGRYSQHRDAPQCPILPFFAAVPDQLRQKRFDPAQNRLGSSPVHCPRFKERVMVESGSRVHRGSSAKRVGKIMRSSLTRFAAMAIATAGLILSPLPAAAQMTEVDPNTAIDSDLDNPNQTPPPPATNETPDYGTDYRSEEHTSEIQ